MAFRKELSIRVTLAAFGIAGLWMAWSQQPPRQPLTMEKVSANLWVVVGNGGNVAVMPTSQGVIIVDDKFAADAPDILAKVKTISDQPVKYVLNTHQHGDHTGGNAAMLSGGAEIIIHKQARANMVRASSPASRASPSATSSRSSSAARKSSPNTSAAATPMAMPSSSSPVNASCTPVTYS